MSKNDKSKNDALDSLVGWMENLEGTPSEELKTIRRDLGHDVEGTEQRFLSRLRKKSKALGIDLKSRSSIQSAPQLDGLLREAERQGYDDAEKLAEATGLSAVLVTMLDLGLIYFPSIPSKIVSRVASAINSSVEALSQYLQLGPRFAANMSFKSEEAPQLEEPQDFFEAVLDDPTLSDDHRAQLMALKGHD